MAGGQFNMKKIVSELSFASDVLRFFLYEQYSMSPQTESTSLYAMNFFRMYIQKA